MAWSRPASPEVANHQQMNRFGGGVVEFGVDEKPAIARDVVVRPVEPQRDVSLKQRYGRARYECPTGPAGCHGPLRNAANVCSPVPAGCPSGSSLNNSMATHPCRCPGDDSHTRRGRSHSGLWPGRVLGNGSRYIVNRCCRFEGPGYQRLTLLIDQAEEVLVAAPSVLEAGMVLSSRMRQDARPVIQVLLRQVRATVVPFDHDHGAFLRLCRGRHAAALNFGDCISYAVSSLAGQPLLYIGDDFSGTDIAAAA